VIQPLQWFERRLGGLLAWYLALLVVVVTLAPFEVAWPSRPTLVGFVSLSDVIANVGFFLPLGFALEFSGRRRPALVALGMSLLVEMIQEFVPGRAPSLLDVATNTLGAWIGAELCRMVRARLAARADRVGVLALDLPLVGLFYLLTPLLWLTGLSAGEEPVRRALAALVGVAGALILAAVDRHYLRPRGMAAWVAPVAGGCWYAVGLIPGWLDDPGYVVTGALVVGVTTWVCAIAAARGERFGARYEAPTLRRIAMPLTVHMVVAACWPLQPRVALGFGLGQPVSQLGTSGILAALELIAACTVVGYALAEIRGRVREPVKWSRTIVIGQAISVAILLTGFRAFNARLGASLVETALYAAAAGFGSLLYVRQREYVRAVLGRRTMVLSRRSYGRMGGPLPVDASP